MKKNPSLIYRAWKKLIAAYLISFVCSLFLGIVSVKVLHIEPENLYAVSTKRLSYALPILTIGKQWGVDFGILLFLWNAIGALLTLSFIYTATWFDPHRAQHLSPIVRKLFCGKTRMKLLCYLPGCAKIDQEPLRRLYVWVMVPLLGMILLGFESGLTVSTGTHFSGSFFSALVSLAPHGLVEIPTLALAGAVPYSAHLLMRNAGTNNRVSAVFEQVKSHRNTMPIPKIIGVVICGMFVAGLLEAHVTQRIMTVF